MSDFDAIAHFMCQQTLAELDWHFMSNYERARVNKEEAHNFWGVYPIDDGYRLLGLPPVFIRSGIMLPRPGDLLQQLNRSRCVAVTLISKQEHFSEWTLTPWTSVDTKLQPIVVVNPEAEVEVDKLLAGIDYFFRPFTCPVLIPTEEEMVRYAPQQWKATRIFQIDGFKDDDKWGPSILIPLIKWWSFQKRMGWR